MVKFRVDNAAYTVTPFCIIVHCACSINNLGFRLKCQTVEMFLFTSIPWLNLTEYLIKFVKYELYNNFIITLRGKVRAMQTLEPGL